MHMHDPQRYTSYNEDPPTWIMLLAVLALCMAALPFAAIYVATSLLRLPLHRGLRIPAA
jgi:hypothetical protein